MNTSERKWTERTWTGIKTCTYSKTRTSINKFEQHCLYYPFYQSLWTLGRELTLFTTPFSTATPLIWSHLPHMGAPVCRVFCLELNATLYPTLHSPIYTRSQVADIQPRLYDVLRRMWDTISSRLLFWIVLVISAVSLVRWPSQKYALCNHMQDLAVVPPPRTPPSQFCCVWSVRRGDLEVWIAVLSVPLSFLAFRSQSPLSTAFEAASPGDTNKENTWATPGSKVAFSSRKLLRR